MKTSRFFLVMALSAIFSISAFAMPDIVARSGSPAIDNAVSNFIPTSTFDVAAIQADSDRQSVPAFEVAVSPPDFGITGSASNQTHRIAADLCTNPFCESANVAYRQHRIRETPETPNDYQRFNEPDVARESQPPNILAPAIPFEATARSGSL